MTTEPTPLVTVLPCDRQRMVLYENASAIPLNPSFARDVLDGKYDTDYRVQAFARHRLAALEAAAKVLDARAAEYRSAQVGCSLNEALGLEKIATELDRQATAIRALSNKTGEGSNA